MIEPEWGPVSRREWLGLALVLLAGIGLRVWKYDQPIVENYVGRQIPTAMVARNLERGSGFGRPQLDTGPFPNLFLVEPPVFAALAVGLKRVVGLRLEACGRVVSALGIGLGAWGLYGLVRRRHGATTGLIATTAFLLFPVTVRYGRAFQGDALMLGCAVAALDLWDKAEVSDRARATLAYAGGWILLATALALKITIAHVLIPLYFAILLPPRMGKLGLVALAFVPVLAWYVHANALLTAGGGSLASADNRAIWLSALVSTAWFERETYVHVGRFLLLRAFTPLGVVQGVMGLVVTREGGGKLWRVWSLAAAATLIVLGAKLHHEYYWLILSPPLAAGVGLALVRLSERGGSGRWLAAGLGGLFIVMAVAFSASTWRTPEEWETLDEVSQAAREHVPPDAWIVAPEAVLHATARRGCRLEFGAASAQRAAGEWEAGVKLEDGPLALVDFYRGKGAAYLVDVGDSAGSAERRALHEAVRGRYTIRVDRPGAFVAQLNGRD